MPSSVRVSHLTFSGNGGIGGRHGRCREGTLDGGDSAAKTLEIVPRRRALGRSWNTILSHR